MCEWCGLDASNVVCRLHGIQDGIRFKLMSTLIVSFTFTPVNSIDLLIQKEHKNIEF